MGAPYHQKKVPRFKSSHSNWKQSKRRSLLREDSFCCSYRKWFSILSVASCDVTVSFTTGVRSHAAVTTLSHVEMNGFSENFIHPRQSQICPCTHIWHKRDILKFIINFWDYHFRAIFITNWQFPALSTYPVWAIWATYLHSYLSYLSFEVEVLLVISR